jgi:hypothetical protein
MNKINIEKKKKKKKTKLNPLAKFYMYKKKICLKALNLIIKLVIRGLKQ